VRWVLQLKKVPYEPKEYQAEIDKEELERTTGLSTVPVLWVDGELIGDSDTTLEWLEARYPTPRLLPDDIGLRVQARAWEITATQMVAPFARLTAIGRFRSLGFKKLGEQSAQKYDWSPEADAHAQRTLGLFLPELAQALESKGYLVGDGFTRADLTMACMLMPVVGPPPDELFALDAGTRSLFGIPLAQPSIAPLRAWRDSIYQRYRGGRVTPA
jgi:glutathione S-transferase